jgi:hypothetical protein
MLGFVAFLEGIQSSLDENRRIRGWSRSLSVTAFRTVSDMTNATDRTTPNAARRPRRRWLVAVAASLVVAPLTGLGEIAHADQPTPAEPVPAEPPVETGESGGATVAVAAPPVPVSPVPDVTLPDVAVGQPPVPPVTLPDAVPDTVVVAVGRPPVVPNPVPDAAVAGHAVNVPSHGSEALVAGNPAGPAVLPATRAAAAAAASAALSGSVGSLGVMAAIAAQA